MAAEWQRKARQNKSSVYLIINFDVNNPNKTAVSKNVYESVGVRGGPNVDRRFSGCNAHLFPQARTTATTQGHSNHNSGIDGCVFIR